MLHEIDQALEGAGRLMRAHAFMDEDMMRRTRTSLGHFLDTHPIAPRPITYHPRGFFPARFFYVSATVCGITLMLGSIAFAAHASLPGDVFYPVKRSIESITLAAASTPQAKATLHLKYADRRIDELAKIAPDAQDVNELEGIISDYSIHIAAAEQELEQIPREEAPQELFDLFESSSTRGASALTMLADTGDEIARVALIGHLETGGAGTAQESQNNPSSWSVAYEIPPTSPDASAPDTHLDAETRPLALIEPDSFAPVHDDEETHVIDISYTQATEDVTNPAGASFLDPVAGEESNDHTQESSSILFLEETVQHVVQTSDTNTPAIINIENSSTLSTESSISTPPSESSSESTPTSTPSQMPLTPVTSRIPPSSTPNTSSTDGHIPMIPTTPILPTSTPPHTTPFENPAFPSDLSVPSHGAAAQENIDTLINDAINALSHPLAE